MNRDNNYLIGNQFAKGHKPNATTFKQGQPAWNKGIRKITSPKCEKTFFKKGMKPKNLLPLGSVTVRTDKAGKSRRWIKTSEVAPRWTIYSHWLWEKNHGRIPRGLLVHHMDHDAMNDVISNYCLVTRCQHINHHRSDLTLAKTPNMRSSPESG